GVTEEYFFLVVAVFNGAKLFGHAPFRDHAAGHRRRLLDVARGAGGHVLGPEDQLLGNPTAEHDGNLRLELDLGHAVTITLKQRHGDTERAAARDDRHLV